MPENLNYIDLFAGAGGLSEGFIRAGFNPIAHVEMDPHACLTLKTRLAFHYLKSTGNIDSYVSYLKKQISREELYKLVPEPLISTVINEKISGKTIGGIFGKIDTLLEGRPVHLIIGGPPCQAYSIPGRAADHKGMKWDSRNFLYKQYARFLERYDPQVFLFENVPGLYSANKGKYLKSMTGCFENLGYTVDHRILDAADFGVVQRRRRVILIGWKSGLKFQYPNFPKQGKNQTVGAVLYDLPTLKAGESIDLAPYTQVASEYLLTAGIRNGLEFATQHIARPHNDADLKIYKLAIRKMESNDLRLRYNEVPGALRTQKNTEAFVDRFKVVRRDDVSHTVIAHISKDGHHYIHPDPAQLRSISVREAARIQSFPDDFYFEPFRTSAFKQIGNAVPPLMATVIAEALKEILS